MSTPIFSMHTFSYIPDPASPYDLITVTVSTNSPSLNEVVEAFERYLKASGFVFDGHLDFTNEE